MAETYAETMKKITQESVYQALLILLQDKKFENLTITEITKRAGVSRPAFYRSYQTKEDIVLVYARNLFDEILQKERSIPNRTKEGTVQRFFEYFDQQHEFMEMLINCELTNVIYDEFCLRMEDFFREQTDQLAVSKLHEQYLAQYLSSGLFRVLIEWIRGGRKESTKEIAEFIFDVTGR